MQVLTGKVKGKKLKVPGSKKVRPTTSRVKKSIFDKLGDIEGLKVLDLFAGSGGLGIEALSKNAVHVTFVEKDGPTGRLINENIDSCGFSSFAKVIISDYGKALKYLIRTNEKFDLIFIDPPYEIFDEVGLLELFKRTSKLLNHRGTVVIEHNQDINSVDSEFELETKKYGSTNITFFRSLNYE